MKTLEEISAAKTKRKHSDIEDKIYEILGGRGPSSHTSTSKIEEERYYDAMGSTKHIARESLDLSVDVKSKFSSTKEVDSML
mmetsp:Transcript_16589/g.19194  ORF Transcript_16589/g.19194 Transcript_16589/m.19194 type:complete len:82 (-) Transcript_16589:66-311(-)